MVVLRFLAALLLVEAIVGAGVALERQKLKLHQQVSARSQDLRRAEEQQHRHLLRVSQLSAATRVLKHSQTEPAPPQRKPPAARRVSAPRVRRDRNLLRAGRR